MVGEMRVLPCPRGGGATRESRGGRRGGPARQDSDKEEPELGRDAETLRPCRWTGDALALLDQRVLPERVKWLRCGSAGEVARAIREMVVRGAPAIGITAAYGVVLAARRAFREQPERWREGMEGELAMLAAARPTAVNLAWALERMRRVAARATGDPERVLLTEALAIHEEDVDANRRMGAFGAALIEERCEILTHCNTGSLATGGFGTALGVIRDAWRQGKISQVYADETRPWLQGSRLTAWELVQDDIPVRLLADGAASFLLGRGSVEWVVVGADRVAANGDVANKIGTYSLAVSAHHHGVGFMVVAPVSTIDPDCPDGSAIPIEERSSDELLRMGERHIAAPGADAWNPVFDVTPATLVDVLVTERGFVRPPNRAGIEQLLSSAPGA